MSDQQSICSICDSPLMDIIIDYSDWSGGHLIVVRDVPIRECEDNGHRFFQAKIARSLEKLLEAEKQEEIVPIEIMEVPVFKLPVAV
ncbi:MAG: YgiT-type zinc finger protein [Anaerolineales bacterium]|nr:YgiT-type zinc finger protein [Anaerolineales bacterium]